MRAGLRGEAVGDFALDHDDGAFDLRAEVEEVEEDVGSDVVGQVADYEKLVGRRLLVGVDSVRVDGVAAQSGEIGAENVLLEDLDGGQGSKLFAELRSEVAVEFDGDEAVGTGVEQPSDGSAAGSDFDNGAMGEVAEGVDDSGLRRGADEKVLAEFGSFLAARHLY